MEERFVLVEKSPPIATVRLNRPKVLNALSPELVAQLVESLQALDADPEVNAIVLTGNERAFAAGADIGAMAESTVVDQIRRDMFSVWDKIRKIKKPIIAAVSGWALGGGNEVAMMCDMIVASESAKLRPARDQHRHHARRRRHPAHRPGARARPRPWRSSSPAATSPPRRRGPWGW